MLRAAPPPGQQTQARQQIQRSSSFNNSDLPSGDPNTRRLIQPGQLIRSHSAHNLGVFPQSFNADTAVNAWEFQGPIILPGAENDAASVVAAEVPEDSDSTVDYSDPDPTGTDNQSESAQETTVTDELPTETGQEATEHTHTSMPSLATYSSNTEPFSLPTLLGGREVQTVPDTHHSHGPRTRQTATQQRRPGTATLPRTENRWEDVADRAAAPTNNRRTTNQAPRMRHMSEGQQQAQTDNNVDLGCCNPCAIL